MIDSGYAVLLVFDARPPPNMRFRSGKAQLRIQQVSHSRRTLRQNLLRVPVSLHHHVYDGLNVAVWNFLMEKVRHGIYEDSFRSAPAERFRQFVRNKAQIESLLVWMTLHTAKPLCECFGIAVFASGTDLRTAANRVPR